MKTAEQWWESLEFANPCKESELASIRAIQADALRWALGHLDGVSDEWQDIYEKVKELEQHDR